ncbi:hypothetical protein ScPMuIL_009416 [Solemya velum]
MEYVGEVITNEEAERRGMEYDATGRTYLFDLDYNDGDCPFTVDACNYGNVSHFVNHSCDPNLEVYGVWINTLDPRLPRIALFSKRDIQKGEELTFDYMMTGDTTEQNVIDLTEAENEGKMEPLEQNLATTGVKTYDSDGIIIKDSIEQGQISESGDAKIQISSDAVLKIPQSGDANDQKPEEKSDIFIDVPADTVIESKPQSETEDTPVGNAASEGTPEVATKPTEIPALPTPSKDVVVPKKQPKLVIVNSAASKSEQDQV